MWMRSEPVSSDFQAVRASVTGPMERSLDTRATRPALSLENSQHHKSSSELQSSQAERDCTSNATAIDHFNERINAVDQETLIEPNSARKRAPLHTQSLSFLQKSQASSPLGAHTQRMLSRAQTELTASTRYEGPSQARDSLLRLAGRYPTTRSRSLGPGIAPYTSKLRIESWLDHVDNNPGHAQHQTTNPRTPRRGTGAINALTSLFIDPKDDAEDDFAASTCETDYFYDCVESVSEMTESNTLTCLPYKSRTLSTPTPHNRIYPSSNTVNRRGRPERPTILGDNIARDARQLSPNVTTDRPRREPRRIKSDYQLPTHAKGSYSRRKFQVEMTIDENECIGPPQRPMIKTRSTTLPRGLGNSRRRQALADVTERLELKKKKHGNEDLDFMFGSGFGLAVGRVI